MVTKNRTIAGIPALEMSPSFNEPGKRPNAINDHKRMVSTQQSRNRPEIPANFDGLAERHTFPERHRPHKISNSTTSGSLVISRRVRPGPSGGQMAEGELRLPRVPCPRRRGDQRLGLPLTCAGTVSCHGAVRVRRVATSKIICWERGGSAPSIPGSDTRQTAARKAAVRKDSRADYRDGCVRSHRRGCVRNPGRVACLDARRPRNARSRSCTYGQ